MLRSLLVLATCCPALAPGEIACAAEKRDKQWLIRYLAQTIPDTPLNRRYLKVIDRAELLGLVDRQWLKSGTQSSRGRGQAMRIGQLAFAYRTQGTRWYQHPKLLADVRAGLEGFAAHQIDNGRFVWPEEHRWEYQAHEHVWRMEPLLLAYLWVKDELSKAESDKYEKVFRRAGEYLIANPLTQANNRGAVWCAGTALCGLYFEDPRYQQLLDQHAGKLMRAMVNSRGEILESQGGAGPDGNYTYVGCAYVALYRLLSGADDLDDRLRGACRWLTQYACFSGDLLASGGSVRKADDVGDVLAAVPLLERYAADDPFFAFVSDRYFEAQGPGSYGRGGLVVHPLIWALLEPRRVEPAKSPPDWYINHTAMYNHSGVQYVLISRPVYKTGVAFRGFFRMKGLQTFSVAGERPLIQHDGRRLKSHSHTSAGGMDTGWDSVSHLDEGRDVWLKTWTSPPAWKGQPPATLITRREQLWTFFAFTPASLVVVYGGIEGPYQSIWTIPQGKIQIDTRSQVIRAEGNQATIRYLRGTARVHQEEGVPAVRVRADRGPVAFGFSDDSLRLGKYDSADASLVFSDSAGRYRLSLKDIVDADGNIDRTATERMVVSEAKSVAAELRPVKEFGPR